MPRRFRKALVLLLLTLLLGSLAAAALWWWLPRAADQRLRTALETRTQTLGLRVAYEDLRILSPRNIDLHGLCIALENGSDAACIDRFRIALGALRPWPPQPTGILAEGGWVDPDATLSLIQHVRASRRDTEDAASTEEREAMPALAERLEDLTLQARRIDIRREGESLFRMERAELVARDDEGLRAEARFADASSARTELPGALQLGLPERFRVSAALEESIRMVEIRSDTGGADDAFRVTHASGTGASFATLRVQWPGTLHFEALRVASPSHGVEVSVGEAELIARHFTTNPDLLHLERLRLDDLRATLPSPAGAWLARPPEQDESAQVEDADEDAPTPEEAEHEPSRAREASPLEPVAREWFASRRWYEAIPQAIEVSDADIRFVPEPGATPAEPWRVTNLELRYALRVLRFQMDIALAFELHMADHPPAPFDIEAVWGYTQRNIQLDFDAQRVHLPSLVQILRGAPEPRVQEGFADLGFRYRETRRAADTSLEGSLALRDFTLGLNTQDDPLTLGALEWRWSAAAEEEDPEGDEIALRFSEGAGRLEGARFDFRPHLLGWDIGRWPPFRSVDFEVEIPDQPAMELFEAIPMAMRRDLDGLQMEGRFGYSLRFEVELGGDPHGSTISIGAPRVHAPRDETLRLVHISPVRDPRRLRSSFRFTFRGPGDRINRPLFVPDAEPLAVRRALRERQQERRAREENPAQRARQGDIALPTVHLAPPQAEGDDADAPQEVSGWARLDEISWYLIAMQLHREDGRFFTNSGINWYQIRRLSEEAWEQRSGFSRGASTISMQLVKNVLLSHERTAARKVQELFLTYWLTRHVPKERTLEIYLNVIEWGPGINGIVEAADWYFGKRPSELSLSEATWLSAITPAPMRRSRQRELGEVPDWYWRQCQQLMRSLHRRGWITEQELSRGLAQRPRFVTFAETPRAGIEEEAGDAALARTLDERPSGEEMGADARSARPPGMLAHPPSERIFLLAEQSRPARDAPGAGAR